jgi:uncharacterized membrane protein YphA (DoxX/SURF4 family)
MTKDTVKTGAFWAATILGPASFVIGGVLNLAHANQATETLSHLGYPAYFAWILGVGKLLGALIIVAPGLPRLKEWAYAGFFFDLTSAAFSRASVGDATADVIAPLGFLALVMISWRLRPANRTLPSPARPVRPKADTTYVSASPLVQRAQA